jgi:hypothetical protein
MDSSYRECPLCKTDLNKNNPEKSRKDPAYPGMDKPLSRSEKVNLFWELSGILLFSSLIVVVLLDIFMNNKPGWSWFAGTGIIATFIYITLFIFLIRKVYWLLAGLLINTSILLFMIDYLHEGLQWFFMPALPLVVIFMVLIAILIWFISHTKHKGLNIIAAGSVLLGIYLLLIDLITAWSIHHIFKPTWSVIAALSVVPFALFLFYFHYRLKRGTSLRKFFHL